MDYNPNSRRVQIAASSPKAFCSMAPAIRVRPYRDADASELLSLFKDTIRRVNSRDYSPEQIAAWASDENDVKAWTTRFDGRFVLVAESGGRVVGFTDLETDGHIDRFYVSADCQRQGVGRTLLGQLIVEARRRNLLRLFTEASITARPFFERFGFVVDLEQTVVARGVEFCNYRMSLPLVVNSRAWAPPV